VLQPVFDALGGSDRIIGIKGFRASLLFGSHATMLTTDPKAIKSQASKDQKERDKAISRAAKTDPDEAKRIEDIPLPDPRVTFGTLEQDHQLIRVEFPSQARNVILNLSSPIGKEGDDVGIDVIEHNGADRLVTHSANEVETRHETVGEETDLSYTLPLLGMFRDMLKRGAFSAESAGTESFEGATVDVYRLTVSQGPFAGSWILRADSRSHLPVKLECIGDYPRFFLAAKASVFSASTVPAAFGGYWPAAFEPAKFGVSSLFFPSSNAATSNPFGLGRVVERALYKRLKEWSQFFVLFGSYREKDGIMYPAFAKTVIVLPAVQGQKEWDTSVLLLSMEWDPKSSYQTLREDLLPPDRRLANEPTSTQATLPATPDEQAQKKLLEIRNFYQQLVWNAVLTFSQSHGSELRMPRYLVIGPQWCDFYQLPEQFDSRMTPNRATLKKLIVAQKETANSILSSVPPATDLTELDNAFDDVAEVVGQGLAVYKKAAEVSLQKWDRGTDADNIAIAAAKVAVELDRQMEARGWKFAASREYFTANGLNIDRLLSADVDLRRNLKGFTKGERVAWDMAMIGSAAGWAAVMPIMASQFAPRVQQEILGMEMEKLAIIAAGVERILADTSLPKDPFIAEGVELPHN
jgi:hypothetical protein